MAQTLAKKAFCKGQQQAVPSPLNSVGQGTKKYLALLSSSPAFGLAYQESALEPRRKCVFTEILFCILFLSQFPVPSVLLAGCQFPV